MAANPTSSTTGSHPQSGPHPEDTLSQPQSPLPSTQSQQQQPQQVQIQIFRLQHTADKLRQETTHLRERLRSEHDAVRALRAQHAAELRSERVAARRRKCELEAQLNTLKNTSSNNNHNVTGINNVPNHNGVLAKCEQCTRLKADFELNLKQEKQEFKKKEELLKAQLKEQISSNISSTSVVVKNCDQCARLKSDFEAELRKERNEFKKKEEMLNTQLKEKSFNNSSANFMSNCDQCFKLKIQFDTDMKKEMKEFKRKEEILRAQLREKDKMVSIPSSSFNCEQCTKLKTEFGVELKKERNEFKKKEELLENQLKEKQKMIETMSSYTEFTSCGQCLKNKAESEAEIRKIQNEFKRKEELLENQLKEKQKLIEHSSSSAISVENCIQCCKYKAEYEAELRKHENEFRKKEEFLETQLKDKQKMIEQSSLTASTLTNCEQCTRYKSECDAELRKQLNEFKKKEHLLKTQLKEKDYFNASKQNVSSVVNCDQCTRLKAEFDSAIRKEKSEFKKKEGLLKFQITDIKKLVGSAGHDGGGCLSCVKFNKEIAKFKETIKDLEEKIQKVNEADKLKAADLRTQHEKHVTELSRITRASKQETHKLLEELKTKDRIIAQLKKNAGRRGVKGEENSAGDNAQMRKLRDDVRKSEQPALLPLAGCDSKPISNHDKFQHNEILEPNSIKKDRNAMVCGGLSEELEPSLEEDIDSAVSSAPSSLSPQPCSPLNDDCHPLRLKAPSTPPRISSIKQLNNTTLLTSHLPDNTNDIDEIIPPPTSLSPQPSEGYTTPPPGLWLINNEEICQNGNDEQASELTMARRQVRELERALLVTRASKPSNRHVSILEDRVRQLEEREASLLRELGDLREQNELLEFRVLELAEGADKTSITNINMLSENQSFQDLNYNNVQENSFILKTETKESSTDTSEDNTEMFNNKIDNLNEDKIRNRLTSIINNCVDDEDQKCLLQILLLLNALDELSKLNENPFLNIEIDNEMQDCNSLTGLAGNNSQSIRNTRHSERDRLVAKVPPFTGRTADSDDEKDIESSSHTNQKITTTCGTQTDALTDLIINEIELDKSLNLTAEVRKLDKLRETIEVVGNRKGRLVVSSTNENICCCDQKNSYQRQLDFYRDRVDILERKISVYESSGDHQAKQLAERLSREIRLEAQVKLLTSTVQKLQSDNSRLDEERCELEEAENDTRLRCQRLEVELSQLEKSKMAAKRRARDARSQASYWESMVNKYEERNYELEERECELRHRLEILEKTAPQLMLLNLWRRMQNDPSLDIVSQTVDHLKNISSSGPTRSRSTTKARSRSPHRDNRTSKKNSPNEQKIQDYILTLENEKEHLLNQNRHMEYMVQNLEKQLKELKNPALTANNPPSIENISIASLHSNEFELIKVVQELKERENEMSKRIENLEKREAAYMETLQQADEIWAEMETGYKKRITEAEKNESDMRDRLRRIQKREKPNNNTLEDDDFERELLARADRLTRENSRLQGENKKLEKELNMFREEILNRKVDPLIAENLNKELNKERKKFQELEQKFNAENIALTEAGNLYRAEIDSLKLKLSRTTNELVHLEVTNGELKEEVDTLESKIAELECSMMKKVTNDEQIIRGLSQELNDKDKELALLKQTNAAAEAGERLDAALQDIKKCDICSTTVNPDLVDTMTGVRTLCHLVSCSSEQQTDDAQARRRRFGRWL